MNKTVQLTADSEKSPSPKIAIGYTRISGLQVRYAESGKENEKKVLMLHGGGVSTGYNSWADIIPAIASEYHVLAPDLPGYGRSHKPKAKATLNYYSDFVDNFMKHMEINKAHIIAESFGGGIAVGFTLEHKEKVKSLILIDSYGFFNKKFPMETYLLTRINSGVQQFMIKTLVKNDFTASMILKSLLRGHNGTGVSESEIKFVQNYVAQHNITRACLEFVQSEIKRNGVRSDFTDRIAELNEMGIPILFIHGTRDALFPIEQQRRAAAKLNNAEFLPVEAAHRPELTNPEIVTPAIFKLLKRAE